MDNKDVADRYSGLKNKLPLVSVMMPVFNAQNFIRHSIESLLKQDYENIELIILDNLSTDDTRKICQEYTEIDSRVRYVCDKTPCISHEAASRLMQYISGDYCMLACDDDLWEPNYISCMLGVMHEHDDVSMVYSRMGYVDVDGNIIRRDVPKLLLKHKYSQFINFALYVRLRFCVPMVFGLFRTVIYRQILPFEVFDETLYDADNHFMLKLLALYKVHGVDETLFYYRFKDRTIEKEGSTDKISRQALPANAFRRFLYLAKHQVVFTREIYKIIKQSRFSWAQRLTLRTFAICSCFNFMLMLIPLINRIFNFIKWPVRKALLALKA